jgi:hypothetical protein
MVTGRAQLVDRDPADDGGAVQEPVEHRGGHGGVTESCCPFAIPTFVVRIVLDCR